MGKYLFVTINKYIECHTAKLDLNFLFYI